MSQDFQEKIQKLPKWAQEYIKDLERSVKSVKDDLEKFADDQTESNFYIQELEQLTDQDGKTENVWVRRYIQGHRMNVDFGGVRLSILLRADGSGGVEDSIELSWSAHDRIAAPANFQPMAFQQARIFLGQYTKRGI